MTPTLRAKVFHEWQPFAKFDRPVTVPSLEALVPGVMKKLGLDQRLHESQIFKYWAEIVGKDIAQHAQPASLHKGVLTIHIDQPIWNYELRPHHPLILKKIQARVGTTTVRKLNFRIG